MQGGDEAWYDLLPRLASSLLWLYTKNRASNSVFVLKRRVGNAAAVYDILPIYADFRLGVCEFNWGSAPCERTTYSGLFSSE